jgi:hypothetical protein
LKRNVLILALIIGLAASAHGQNPADFKVSENNGKITITGYTGAVKDVKIPKTINGRTVLAIGDGAFANNQLISVTIPDSVNSIGKGAFEWCTNLTSVTIPNGVTSIGDSAFKCCFNLTSVTIPNSVTSIGGWAFSACTSLISVTIPSRVTSIGDSAFWGCTSLTSVTIPDSVTSIGNGAFDGCTSLTAINVVADNLAYISENGVLYNKNRTTLIQYPAGKTSTSFVIPNSVTSIGYMAFVDCTNLTSVTIPNSVTFIGDSAFYDNQLTSVTIPSSITFIGEGAFKENRLTSVTIPNSVTFIGDSAFYDNQLTSITIGANVTLGQRAFDIGSTGGCLVYDISTGFETAYNNGGRRAGTYTRPDVSSTTWSIEEKRSVSRFMSMKARIKNVKNSKEFIMQIKNQITDVLHRIRVKLYPNHFQHV